MLAPELIQKANLIFLKSRHKVNDIFSGEFRSAFRGRGIEFEEVREYIPGDDIRQIDWNVTARSGKPHVKTFREEREQTIFFIVDFSGSLDFGRHKTKREVITEIASLLAYAAIKTNDKVGLITFTDQIETFIPPQKGKSHAWKLIAQLLAKTAKGQGTDIAQALQFFLQVQKRRSTCFLISDFLTSGFGEILKVARFRHDLVAVRLLDELETRQPAGALMDFTDLEDGAAVAADFSRGTATRLLQAQNLERDARFKNELAKHKIDLVDLRTHEDPVENLIRFFIRREKRR